MMCATDRFYEDFISNLQRERAMVATAFGSISNFDYEKAWRSYVDKLGVSTDLLSGKDKKQATMDAVLGSQL